MNFLGHLEVARRVHGDDPVVLLGAMLPDLGSPARLKVGPLDTWPAATAAGIECHRRADDAFHADPRFLAGMVALRDELVAAGVARGPARGAAHIGWELLLDAALLERDDVRAAYLGALGAPEPAWSGDRGGASPSTATWRDVVRRYRERGLPAQAMDAAAVAERVVALLARRPRLAVDPVHAPAVTAAFAAIRPTVEAEADAVVTATATSTSATTRTRRLRGVSRGGGRGRRS